MAGVLNFTSLPPITKPIWRHQKANLSTSNSRVHVIKSSAEVSDTTSVKNGTDSISIKPPPNFKSPEPKVFTPRSDKIVDLITASLNLLFRLGTGVFVSG